MKVEEDEVEVFPLHHNLRLGDSFRDSGMPVQEDELNEDPIEHKCLYITGKIVSWLGWILCCMGIIMISSMGYLLIELVILFCLIIMFIKFILECYEKSSYYQKNKKQIYQDFFSKQNVIRHCKIFREVYKKNSMTVLSQLLLIVILMFVLPIYMSGSCICFFNEGWGLPIGGGGINWSSAISRSLSLDPVCPSGTICHVYPTLPEAANTSVFINIHSALDIQDITVSYDTESNFMLTQSLQSSVKTKYFTPKGIETNGQRNVHTALLTGLVPGTMYIIQIQYNHKTKTVKYKTPPDTDKPLVVALGGDVGNTKTSSQTINTMSGMFAPDIYYVGGDIAYDNDLRQCYYAYDLFIKQFEDTFGKVGYMVPIILSVGNHDVGYDPNPKYSIVKDESGPFYFLYFPQHTTGNMSDLIPNPPQRQSNHYHVLGNALFISLDTGYDKSYFEQTSWLENLAKSYPHLPKFANYHNPIFTPCGQDFEDQFYALASWAPLFDEYRFMAIFEHHKHVLSRSVPLRNGQKSDEGLYYLGQGAWGVIPRMGCGPPIFNSSGVFQDYGDVNNFWIMKIDSSSDTVSYTAYSPSGSVLIETFNQTISKYVSSA